MEDRKYQLWRDMVKRILVGQKIITKDRELTKDIYLPYFEDGYTPAQAVKEDIGKDAIRFFNPSNT